MNIDHLVQILYLVASGLLIFGLKRLGSPKTAPQGNMLGGLGMLFAILAVCIQEANSDESNWVLVGVGIVVGSVIGIIAAQKVQMTGMPQMVALFNGLGGGASAFVAASEFKYDGTDTSAMTMVPLFLSMMIGALTFTGSLIAFGKLQGIVTSKPVSYPLQKTINLVLFLSTVSAGLLMVNDPSATHWFIVLTALSLVLGVLAVIPIGGADMPVVISLLNSYSGIAASATGFVLRNDALIIAGSLVGASGIILTQIMCKAMNRSLANVLFGGFGSDDSGGAAGPAGPQGNYKSAGPEEVAMILDTASLVIIVPGYGMAVAQAQHQVRELDKALQERGAEVLYAIHPVAGRMPGHMNVLLAEADVPYEQLQEMDVINPSFPRADVAIVLGANDVTNPAARTDKASPIYGMPILDVDKARTVMVLKRSMNPGFAGIENELFFKENTLMVFGDAKDSVSKINSALKEL